jgi:DNA-binding MarR family transcriptional regulator
MDAEAVTRLRAVISKLARRLNASATHEGLSPTQASILSLIVSQGPIGLPRLVEIEGVHPTMLSRVVGKLVDAGLIRRSQDPDDQRSVLVEATRLGRSTHVRIKAQRAAVVSAFVGELTPEHAAALEAALPALEALVAEFARSDG